MLPTLLAQTLWMPEQSSTYADEVDFVFYFIYGISVFFTLLVAGLVIWFAIRYRDHGRRGEQGKGPSHNTALEMTWTIIPLLLVIAIFLFGFRGFLDMATPPDNAYEIVVNSGKWSWSFTYPDEGVTSSELHVPVDRPIKLTLTSRDVIHSLFVPAFRTKKDAVPGRYNQTWFQATRTGEYILFCTEYCGTQHSQMRAKVIVHEPEEFAAWLQEAKTPSGPLHVQGEKIINIQGCMACHVTSETPTPMGPSFRNLYGRQEKLADGSSVLVDDAYIRESIVNPQAKIVAGYQGASAMPTYQGLLSEEQIVAIIAYLKSISVHYEGELPTADEGTDEATDATTGEATGEATQATDPETAPAEADAPH